MKKTKDLYEILVGHSNVDYDRREASKLILKIKHCSCERKIEQMKFELFKKSSKLIVKAINNFWKLVDTMPSDKILHENNDIASESWFIFDRCVQNIKIKDHPKYSFYLNTSLNRGIYRLYEKHYKKHFDVVNNQEMSEYKLSIAQSSSTLADLTNIDLALNFGDKERLVIDFKISGEKQQVFLKENSITKSEFNDILEGIKIKICNLYKEKEDTTFTSLFEEVNKTYNTEEDDNY